MGFTRILDILLQRTISGQQVNCCYPYEHLKKYGIEIFNSYGPAKTIIPIRMPTDLVHHIALTMVPHIGDIHARELIGYFGNAENIFKARKSPGQTTRDRRSPRPEHKRV